MKNKITSSLLVGNIIVISIFIFVAYQNNFDMAEDNTIKETVTKNKDNNFISMMLETAEGSGEYTASTDGEWPKEGYVFNGELSKCQNGSTLTYDAENNQVIIQGNKSDRCYVYFDVASEQTLAAYIKSLYTADGTNGLYYHDGSGTYTNADLEAGDNSYRYVGADPNNYVCFGSTAETCPTDNLYRIIGVFGDQVKLIKADFATDDMLGTSTKLGDYTASSYANYKGSLTTIPRHYWSGSSSNTSNAWASSTLNTSALNSTYTSYLGSTWTDKIATTTWKVGGNTYANVAQQNAKTAYTNEIVSPAESTTYSDEIGLMYVSDYMYAAEPSYWSLPGYSSKACVVVCDYVAAFSDNWMALGIYEWTISRRSDWSNYAFIVDSAGGVNVDDGYTVAYGASRPVFYLKSTVAYASGDGSVEAPIRVGT